MTMQEIYQDTEKWIKEMEAELPDIWDNDLEEAWEEIDETD